MGMEYRPYYLASELIKLGECPTVLTASFSHLRKKNPTVSGDAALINEQGVKYCVINTPAYHDNGTKRAVNVLSFTAKLWQYKEEIANAIKPNAVIVSSTHPFDFFAAKSLAKITDAVLVFELHDIWPLSLIELHGFSPSHPLMLLTDFLERCALEQSDAVVSLLPRLDRYCEERNISSKRIEYLPNAAAVSSVAIPPLSHLEAIKAAKQRFSAVVMYAGGIERANAVDELLRVAELLPEIGFFCVGAGREKEQLQRSKPENITFLPAVEHPQMQRLLRQADILWLGVRNLLVYRYGIAMNKLYDYMASGRPIVISAPCKDNPVSYAKCGITVPPSDKIQTRDAILRILALSSRQRQKIGLRGKLVIEQQYRYQHIAARYQTLLEELIGGKQKET